MKIAVLGAGGLLGRELCTQLAEEGIGYTHEMLDITQAGLAFDMLSAHAAANEPPIDAVINAVAYTNVNGAEKASGDCWWLNTVAVFELTDTCRRLNIPFMQISTSYVFGSDLSPGRPYTEEDVPSPIGTYAMTKAVAERYVARWEKHFIVRTHGLYDVDGAAVGLDRARRGDEVRVVNDLVGTPTYVPHLARALCFLIRSQHYGLYHITNGGETSIYGLADRLFQCADMDVDITPVSRRKPGGAYRPAYVVLNTDKYHALGGPAMPTWQQAVDECVAAIEAE